MGKKQKRNVTTIGKENYEFDYSKEKNIYCYLCGIDCKKKKIQKLRNNEKMNTYAGWKQYVYKKYEGYPNEKLEEFSRYLNLRIRNLKPNQEYLNIVVPILATLVITEISDFLMDLAIIEPNIQIDLSVCSLVKLFLFFFIITLVAIILFIVFLVKVANPIWENHTEEKMLEDYKEIIDSMIKSK